MPSTITFDANGFRIDGRPTWLRSGEMHYFKLNRGDWRRRLVQLKAGGFDTVSVYMPWNYHEVEQGAFDFSGEKDVAHFLALAAETGLYVVARPGPYICDEWQMGGLPPWLSADPSIRYRTSDPAFLAACDRWWDRIAPIIADYQLGRKGTVILAQVENEYGHFGEHQDEAYVLHLRDGLRTHGVEVPVINCDSFINAPQLRPRKYDGICLCCNFGGDAIRTLARARTLQDDAPLFVTEYWIAAFDWWGRDGTASIPHARALNGALAIAAGGAGGLTAFVYSGGAHFAYWHGRSICSDDNFMTTLYGPGAPILDDGLLSDKYYLFKRDMAALGDLGEELAQAGMPELSVTPDGLRKAVRRGPRATFTFWINESPEAIAIADTEKEQACVDMDFPAGAVRWTVEDAPLGRGLILKSTRGHIAATTPALVLSDDAGREVSAVLTTENGDAPEVVEAGELIAETTGGEVRIRGTVRPGDLPMRALVRAGGELLPVLFMDTASVRRMYRLDWPGTAPALIGGPDRIEDVRVEEGGLATVISCDAPRRCWHLEDGAPVGVDLAFTEPVSPKAIPVADVAVSTAFPESEPGYDDTSWTAAEDPLPMARFGHGHGRAWYRTRIRVREAGMHAIVFSGAADHMLAFVDGAFFARRGSHAHCGWHLWVHLEAGEHTLACLVENLGMFNSGAEHGVPLGEPKGLYGPVRVNGAQQTGWRMRTGVVLDEPLEYWPEAGNRGTWSPCDETVRTPCWVQGTFKMAADFHGAVRLDLGTAGAKGSAWLNGRNLGRYWRVGPQTSLWMPQDWLEETNKIVLLEDREFVPGRLAVSLTPFGHRADWRISS